MRMIALHSHLFGLVCGILLVASTLTGQALTGEAEFTALTYDNGADGSLISPGQAFFDRTANELFVASPGNNRIIVYAPDLTPKYSFPHYVTDPRTKEQKFGEPKAVVVNSQGDLLIVDNLADYLDVLDFRGKPLTRIYPNRLLKDTTLRVKADLVAMDERGNVYLSVTGDIQSILVLDQFLELKRQIVKKGDPDAVSLPLSMAVEDSLLIISDLRGIPVIRVYDTLGQYLFGFGGREIERSDFSLPIAISMMADSSGQRYFLVADALRQVIKFLDFTGKQISNIGGYGIAAGAFRYPSGLTFDGNRTFYVVERVSARIQKFELH